MAADITWENSVKIKYLIHVLNQYPGIVNSYILDYFTDNTIENVHSSWLKALDSISISDLAEFLSYNRPITNCPKWPLSLLCLRKLLQLTAVDRTRSVILNPPIFNEIPRPTVCMQHIRLKNLFVKHVKPKKRYEVMTMAAECARLAEHCRVACVLDIGSGLGHLCRSLGYGYGVKVIGVEAQTQLTAKARLLDDDLEVTAGKYLSNEEMENIKKIRPHHSSGIITKQTSSEQILQIVKENLGEIINFGIVGLHPCGDLGPTLMRLFVNCPSAKFIHIAGCCYHKMTFSNGDLQGYPMSQHCQDKYQLTELAASLGCHAIESYSERLLKGDYHHLKIHCFRAALERIICKHHPQHARSGLNNVKHSPDMSFTEYCEKALQKVPFTVPMEDINSTQTQEDLSRWKEVVQYYSLWLMFGPAIESLILLDRVLYLQEQGTSCRLWAAFDPLISPRNQILTAWKNT